MFNKLTRQLFFILMLAGIFFTACSKTTVEQTATLQITVKHIAGGVISGATVNLYKYELPPSHQILATQITGTNGIVTFNNLSPIAYGWDAEKGCQKGQYGTWLGPLNIGILNKGVILVIETGTLKLINNSSETYLVNGFQATNALNLLSNTTYFTNLNAGPYTIHGEPISTPGIGRDTLINIVCSDTATITYPY